MHIRTYDQHMAPTDSQSGDEKNAAGLDEGFRCEAKISIRALTLVVLD